MRILFLGICALVFCSPGKGQTLANLLRLGTQKFLNDPQNKNAVVGFYVQDPMGAKVYGYQENYGLAPASAQKVITAVTMYETVKAGFTYPTRIAAQGRRVGSMLQGDLLVYGSGDPTIGSWRYSNQSDSSFFLAVLEAIKQQKINRIQGNIIAAERRFSVQATPGGWAYNDMGNYYGAGHWALNYHENQYDLVFPTAGPVGESITPIQAIPDPGFDQFNHAVTLKQAGTGDNAYIFASPYSTLAYTQGSLARNGSTYTISGALPNGEQALLGALKLFLQRHGITVDGQPIPSINLPKSPTADLELLQYQSVPLDSMVYWFLQKSINLYGEAFLKTMALQEKGFGSTDLGIEWVQAFWKDRGIEKAALNMKDACGLSPGNRVTAKTLVQVMHYAKSKPWFGGFYAGLPSIHQIKMKSGTIGDVKSYTGYVTGKSGKQYSFALLVNNYSGSHNALVQKMWQLIDILLKG